MDQIEMTDDDVYWCVVCGRGIAPQVIEGENVYVHDDVPHPYSMTFDEEDVPQ